MKKNSHLFHYKNLSICTHKEVYEPSEDTFILLDVLDTRKNDYVFEIGMGTGIISLSCAQTGARVICSDINPYAILLTKRNIEENKNKLKGSIHIRKGSMFKVLAEDEKFDLIIFNPPYLPTSINQYLGGNGWFDKAVDGGKDGLQVIIQFIEELPKHLLSNGRAFIIVSSQSPQKKLKNKFRENNLYSTIVAQQSFSNETIEVHRISKQKD